jgi:hypothetical protein
VAVDSSGNVYVADTGNHRIQKFTSEGVFLTKWGTQGVGDAGLFYPHGIAVDDSGVVYVADTSNQVIKAYRPGGVTPEEKQLVTWGGVKQTELYQNYPNPFNPETWIPYQLVEGTDVTIGIYDATGRVVRILSLGRRQAGFYTNKDKAAYWDGKNDRGESVASGIYFYVLYTKHFEDVKKMIIAE